MITIRLQRYHNWACEQPEERELGAFAFVQITHGDLTAACLGFDDAETLGQSKNGILVLNDGSEWTDIIITSVA